MTRPTMKLLFSTAVIGTLALGAAGAASAAPVAHAGRVDGVRQGQSLVQPVHWEWHHHRRVWVPDHHRYHRYYR